MYVHDRSVTRFVTVVWLGRKLDVDFNRPMNRREVAHVESDHVAEMGRIKAMLLEQARGRS